MRSSETYNRYRTQDVFDDLGFEGYCDSKRTLSIGIDRDHTTLFLALTAPPSVGFVP